MDDGHRRHRGGEDDVNPGAYKHARRDRAGKLSSWPLCLYPLLSLHRR